LLIKKPPFKEGSWLTCGNLELKSSHHLKLIGMVHCALDVNNMVHAENTCFSFRNQCLILIPLEKKKRLMKNECLGFKY
jgi:hypothetical protein